MRKFTLEELAQYDGSDSNPIYAAYKGKVYDVSSGPNWSGGAHYEHSSGEDLTEAMDNAPHGDDVMDAFPVVGELIT